jgi:hypothetical protein
MERIAVSARARRRRGLTTCAIPMFAVITVLTMVSVAPSAASSTTKLWVERYDSPAGGDDSADAVAVSPDGSTVFVTGLSENRSCTTQCLDADDYATIAYDKSTGATLWTKRYDGPADDADLPESIAVSPDGSRVFVTGESRGTTGGFDYATVAYDAASGMRLWVKRYNGPGNADDAATALGVSPAGGRVFVTGWSTGSTTGTDYATIAYDETTGTRLWTKRYNGPDNAGDLAVQLSVAPGGASVFVTGTSQGTSSGNDYATIAYDAATGDVGWVARYNGSANLNETATSLAVSPDGTKVIVTGDSIGTSTGEDYATVAYDGATGTRLWSRRYNPTADGDDVALSIAISPDGSAVFVTGESGSPTVDDYATVAYGAATGATLWSKRYDGTGHFVDVARCVATSPSGSEVFVTGSSQGAGTGVDFATIAYDATTGAKLWVRRYDGPAGSTDAAHAMAVSPDRSMLVITGESQGTAAAGTDYATIAYAV